MQNKPKNCTLVISSRGWWWLRFEKHTFTLTEYPKGLTQTYYAVKFIGFKLLVWCQYFGAFTRYQNEQILRQN